MTYEGMSGEELFARFREMNELGGRALQANNLAQAEGAYEEAARISGALARVEPRHDILLAYWHSLRNLAETLRRMGANPETEELLEEAVGVARNLVIHNPNDAEAALAATLIALAKVYRGSEFYVAFGRPPFSDLDSMREYRLDQVANGTWGGPMASGASHEWRGRAEKPLLEVIPLLRRLARTQRAPFESQLALALNLLGEMYVNTGRAADAESPLREAEALYRGLVRDDLALYQPLLTDTLNLLVQATQGDPQLRDRISALEEVLPSLRLEGSLSDDEREHGVTMAKANARDRLRRSLEELASLYEEAGMQDAARALWRGELGVLMTESLKVVQ